MTQRLRPMIFIKTLPYMKTEELRRIEKAELSKVDEAETQRIIHKRFKRQQLVKFRNEYEGEKQKIKKKYQKQISKLKKQNDAWIKEDKELNKLIKKSKLIRSALITESFHHTTAERIMEQYSIMSDSEYSEYSTQSESDIPIHPCLTDHEKESNHSDSDEEM